MATIDADIERRIVRYLDGALNAEEALELERELLRDPEARLLFEEYRRVDELTTDVLTHVIGEGKAVVNVDDPQSATQSRRMGRAHLVWWLLPGAMAAALMLVVFGGPELRVDPGPLQEPFPRAVESGERMMGLGGLDSTPVLRPKPSVQNVSHAPARRRVKRDVYRDVFGVVGEDGNVYWIQVDKVRTIKRPHSKYGPQRPVGDM